MSIAAKQLMDYAASLEEQLGFAEPAFAASETLKSLFTPITQQAGIVISDHFTRIAQQFENIAQEALSGIARQIEDSHKAALSSIAQQIGAINTDYYTKFIQEAFGSLGRYSGPAFTPPPLYVRQSPPQLPPNVKYVNGSFVYIDDYEPGLN